MEYFNSPKKLFGTAFLLFTLLTLVVAILPAINNQNQNKPLPNMISLTDSQIRGKNVFISNGCVACHTQQVRSVEMDRIWGDRPGVAADYAGNQRISNLINTATLMGTERTGPDLSNVGKRQPSLDWNLLHLYNPRTVVSESIMPSYTWLFYEKVNPSQNEVTVNIPANFRTAGNKKVIATQDALDLVSYLQSLKQLDLIDRKVDPFFYKSTDSPNDPSKIKTNIEGKNLYSANCLSCHQATGEGIPGAFPPLKGSKIINGDNLELYIDIIMNGYDARAEYGVMPAVGMNMKFDEKQVAAIINYERSNWGNTGKKVSESEVKKMMELITQKITKR